MSVTEPVMYLSHFGLREAPFTITPDPRYLYMSDRHREALAHLLYGVNEGGGFVQLTGEVGTGKTTLCRCLLEQLPSHVDVALILNPRLTSLELLATVCDELHIAYLPGTDSLKTLVDALYEHLLDAHTRGRRTVVIVDEAQDLSTEVLEQVRLLTNLETAREKLLQIILIGQPELIAILDREDMRQLAQRITARYHLEPFSPADTRAYIRHRLQVAGRTRGVLTDGAFRRVHSVSGGVPRIINVICDRALLGAYAHQKAFIDARTVSRAAVEVRGRRTGWGLVRSWSRRWVTVATAGAVVIAGLVVVSSLHVTRPAATGVAPASAVVAAATTRAPLASPRAPGAPASTVTAVLAQSPSADSAPAFEAVFRRWGVQHPEVTASLGCDGARAEGLKCLVGRGTWNRLRRYNVPAVIELRGTDGQPHHVAVTALTDQTVTLEVRGRSHTVPLAQLEPVWDGEFTAVWKPPALRNMPIAVGMRGTEIEWVRERLAAADGVPVDGRTREVFDDELRKRVIAFQRTRAIEADGVVGDETLLHLAVATPAADVPVLIAARAK